MTNSDFHRSADSLELKPCPFCGGQAGYYAAGEAVFKMNWTGHVCHCKNCQARVSTTAGMEAAAAMWNARALTSITAPAQAEQQPIAFVPVHPRNGPLWSDTYAADSFSERSPNYPRMALYAAQPPAAPVETVAVPKVALSWLFGEAPAPDGNCFGDDEDIEIRTPRKFSRKFWWRSRFRELIKSSDGCGEVGQSPALASEGHQRPLEHGVMPVGPMTEIKSGPGASPSDPQCSAGNARALELADYIEQSTPPTYMDDVMLDRTDREIVIAALRHMTGGPQPVSKS